MEILRFDHDLIMYKLVCASRGPPSSFSTCSVHSEEEKELEEDKEQEEDDKIEARTSL